jgi:hypothetical protein
MTLTLTELALLREADAVKSLAKQRDILSDALVKIVNMPLNASDTARGKHELPRMREIAKDALAAVAEHQSKVKWVTVCKPSSRSSTTRSCTMR